MQMRDIPLLLAAEKMDSTLTNYKENEQNWILNLKYLVIILYGLQK